MELNKVDHFLQNYNYNKYGHNSTMWLLPHIPSLKLKKTNAADIGQQAHITYSTLLKSGPSFHVFRSQKLLL